MDRQKMKKKKTIERIRDRAEMSQWVKALTSTCGNLRLIPETHIQIKVSLQCPLTLIHTSWHAHPSQKGKCSEARHAERDVR